MNLQYQKQNITLKEHAIPYLKEMVNQLLPDQRNSGDVISINYTLVWNGEDYVVVDHNNNDMIYK